MKDNQFPMLSFQDGLTLLYGESDNCQQDILEVRNSAPLFRTACISPTNLETENLQNPSPFRCGPIDLLNTPSPKKNRRDGYSIGKSSQQNEASAKSNINNNQLHKDTNMDTSCKDTNLCGLQSGDGKKLKRSKANHGNTIENSQITSMLKTASEQGNPRMVMRFSDIRNGLNMATLSSDNDTSEILQSRPMYKNISKTLFAEHDTNEQVKTGTCNSSARKQTNDNNLSACRVDNIAAKENSCGSSTPCAIPPPATAQLNDTSHQVNFDAFIYPSEPQGSYSWYQHYSTPKTGLPVGSTPKNTKLPECSAITYTPASLCSESSVSLVSPEYYQHQFTGQEGYQCDDKNVHCTIGAGHIAAPNKCHFSAGNTGNEINFDQLAANQTCTDQATMNGSFVQPSLNTANTACNYLDNRYFVPIPVASNPPPRTSRKRKLIFEHIPTQQSSLKERIKYWEMEGSLRTTGDPGLPGSKSMKVSKDEPGVIYCDTPPTEEESESEELYGVPKLLRMNPVKLERDRSGDKSSDTAENTKDQQKTVGTEVSNSPEVIEIEDDDSMENNRETKPSEIRTTENPGFHAGNCVNFQTNSQEVFPPKNINTPSGNALSGLGSNYIPTRYVNMTAPSTPNHSTAYIRQGVIPNFHCIPTPPTTPLLSTQQPVVQVLQFNPSLLHIQSLNVGGSAPTQAFPSSIPMVQSAFPQSYIVDTSAPATNAKTIAPTLSHSVPGRTTSATNTVPVPTNVSLTSVQNTGKYSRIGLISLVLVIVFQEKNYEHKLNSLF